MKYAVIQYRANGCSLIFGVGETKNGALEDADEYVEESLCWSEKWETLTEKERGGYSVVFDAEDRFVKRDGQLMLVRCSDRLAGAVGEKGGDIKFVLDDNYACMPDEIEGN